MSTTVKSLKVTHTPVNEGDTFTNGDEVRGQVTLEVVKECNIDSLYIKFKGKSEVVWTERYGQTTVVYSSKDKYFSKKSYFIKDDDNPTHYLLKDESGAKYSNVVAPGIHVYPFTFTFPLSQDMPSSFQGIVGKIIYSLEARMGRSMRIPKKDMDKLKFVGNVDLNGELGLLEPQHESKDKKLKIFSSGTVSMDVHLDKTGFFQGEGIKVKALIKNNSSRPIKPKYCLYRKHSFFAGGKRKVDTMNLLREVGDPIPPATEETVTRVINIPLDLEPSIHNCVNIKSEHRLRVYLDVKYATDPKIKLPVVILPISGMSALESPPAESNCEKKSFWDSESLAEGEEPSELPALDAAESGEEDDTQPLDAPPPYEDFAMYSPPRQ